MFYKEKFKNIRTSKKLSQNKIGEIIGKSKRTIQRWEDGSNEPNSFCIRLLAGALNVSTTEISDIQEGKKVLPYFYNNLNRLDKSIFDISTKTETEKQELLIELQNKIEHLLWENNFQQTTFKQFSEIIQSIRLLIFQKDSNQKYTFVNNYFLSYFNISNDRIVLGNRNKDIWKNENSWDDLTKLENEVFNSGYRVTNRKITIPKFIGQDGKGIASITPVLDNKGKIISIVGSILDLTGEEILREKYFYIESVLDNLEHVVWIVKIKPFKHYLYISKAVSKIYNSFAVDFYKNVNYWQNFIKKEDRKRILKEIENGSTELLYRIQLENGTTKWIQHFTYLTEINNEKFEFGIIKDITEIKKAQEALELLDLNVNEMSEGLIIFDMNTDKIVYLNKAVTKITGYEQEKILTGGNVFWKENIVEESFKQLYKQSILDAKINNKLEYKIIKKDGTQCWIRSRFNIGNYQNKLCHIAIINDITEEKKSKDIKEMLQLSIDAMTDGLFVAETDTNEYIYINNAIAETYGYAVEDFYKGGREFWRTKCLHPDFFHEHDRIVPCKEGAQKYQFKVIRSDGGIRWIDSTVNSKVIYGKKCFISIEKDITEQKTKEDIYALLELSIENASCGIIIATKNFEKITYVNNTFEKITRLSGSIFINKNIHYLLKKLNYKKEIHSIEEIIDKNISIETGNGKVINIFLSIKNNNFKWSEYTTLMLNII